MAPEQHFQFSLGPVQSFVAQARRTRDFWAGSFILSWLSGVAMAAIRAQGGTVAFPQPDAGYMAWIEGTADGSVPLPTQGCIPNRFKALTATVPGGFEPARVVDTVRAAWQALADEVWAGDLEGNVGERTRLIWQRQVPAFWEITWALSSQEEPDLLDRRKNWRGAYVPAEGGNKCMMMDGWQELSGVERPDMAAIGKFWSALRAGGADGIGTDLRDGEHLCAIAFIKRRFARHFHKVKVAVAGGGGHVHGWHVPQSVPSVAFLAAAPWIAEVIRKLGKVDAFGDFHACASRLAGHGEREQVSAAPFAVDIRCVREAAEARKVDGFKRLWAGLDGNVYFEASLRNPNIFDDKGAASATLRALRRLKTAAGMAALPSPFYAVLLMDGDRLGKHMRTPARQVPIGKALNRFTAQAGAIVHDGDGFLVYAGGDDVLALLPMERALPMAARLQEAYRESFRAEAPEVDGTLSAAIEYVHLRTPLGRVLGDAHELLDRVAKSEVGRNAVAVRVWKPSGAAVQWAMPWEKALDAQGLPEMCRLAEDFAGDDAAFTNKFFFRARELVERFPTLGEQELKQVLRAEYTHSGGKRAQRDDDLQRLVAQSWRYRRPAVGAEAEVVGDARGGRFNADTALLVRFLAQKGLGREFA